MGKVIVIGNKPYVNLCLNNVVDSFDSNVRCNFGLPNRKNGTKYDQLALSSHGYQSLVNRQLPRDKFIIEYGKTYKEEFLEYLYDFWEKEHKPKYTKIFHAQYRTGIYNQMLTEYGCPYRYTNIPRTGSTMIFENLRKQNKVFTAFFSLIYDDTWISHDTKPLASKDSQFHCKDDETKILMWLHENKHIDATLCMLKDKDIPTLNCKDLEPSEFILNLLKKEHGDVRKINWK